MKRRVVVTGCGVVSSLGDSPATLFEAMIEGRSGIGSIDLFDNDGLGCDRGGEIKGFKARSYLGRRNLRALDRTGALVTTATALALEDGGWHKDAREGVEIGLVIGTVYCSVGTIAAFDRRATEAGPVYASPFDFANSVINAAAGQAAIWHGLRGMNSTIACGAASGLRAIAYAAEAVRNGRADVVIAGGAEELCQESFIAHDRAGRLSATTKAGAPCAVPLHRRRNGVLLGEGAGLVVLESAESAGSRGAKVLAELRGFGGGFDPSRGSDSSRALRASERSIEQALATSGIEPAGISGLSLAADGSPEDLLEGRAVGNSIGDRAAELPVCAVASNLGQCLGAGGGLQTVVAVKSLEHGRLPGVLGLDSLDSAIPLEAARAEAAELGPGAILLNGSSWDGYRSSLVLSTKVSG